MTRTANTILFTFTLLAAFAIGFLAASNTPALDRQTIEWRGR